MNEIIRLEDVVRIGLGNQRFVNGVSLSICEKERVMVCGNPGSGKGTLMSLIAGMQPPNDGKVFVLGKAVHEMEADKAAVFRNRNIGIIRQEPGFMNRLNVFENVSMPLTVQGIPLAKRKQAAKELLGTLGILHIAHAYPAQLMAYEMRLASIARALITQPKILLLYEAAASLSQRDTEKLTGTLGAISQYGEHTLLSFNANAVSGLRMDRKFLMEYGEIQEDRS